MTSLSEQQQKDLAKIRANIAKVEADIRAIEQKNPADWKTKEKLNNELKALEEEKQEAERKNQREADRLDNIARSGSRNYGSQDLYVISVPGGKQLRVSYGELNNLVRQLNIYFSYLDNPFEVAHSDDEKRELLASVLGKQPHEVVIGNVDADNKKKDANWELNEISVNEAKGIVEPPTFSYEWVKRWWNFHKRFPECENVFATKEDILSYEVIDEIPIYQGDRKGIVSYRDVMKIREEKVPSLARAEELIFEKDSNNPQKTPYMLVLAYVRDYDGKKAKPAPRQYGNFYSADFIFFIDTILNNNKTSSLLFQTNGNVLPGKTSPVQYKLSPDSVANKYKWNSLAIAHWEPKSNKTASRDYKDHDFVGLTGYDIGGWNGIELNQAKLPHRFDMAEGVLGMLDVFNDVFIKSKNNNQSIAVLFYVEEKGVMSVPNYERSNPLLTYYSTTGSLKPGDLTGDYEDITAIDKKIADKKKEIFDYDVNAPYKDNDYNLVVAKQRMLSQELIRLRKEEMKLVGEDEAEMRSILTGAERRVNSSGKVAIEDYEYFDDSTKSSFYTRFQEIVKTRLVSEKKLSSDEAKTWKFNGGKAIENEDKDASLRNRAKFETARKKREEKLKEVSPLLLRIGSTLNRFSGNKIEQIEKWVKDKNNVQTAQQLLSDLNELESKGIKLSEESRDIRDVLKKSDLVSAKDLRGFLTEVWQAGGEVVLDEKVFNAFNTYRWRGTKYNEGFNFSRLATHPSDISKVEIDIKGSKQKLFDLIKNNYEKGDIGYDIIGPIYEYRFKDHLGKNSSERDKDYSKEEMLEMLNEAENYYDVTLSSITVGTKSAQDLKDELVKSIGKAKGEALGLDYNRSNELRVIMQWKNYSNEEIRELMTALDEKDKKSTVMSSKPEEIHRKFIDKKIEEIGVKTPEDVKNIKATEKDKIAQLDKLETWLEKAEEKGAATEEHKKLKAAIAAHKVTLTGTDKPGTDKPGTDKPGTDKPGTDKPGTDKPGTDTGKPQGTTATEDKKWWQKGGYAIFWGSALAIAAMVGIWYFAFRKPESSESEEGETTEGEATE